MFLLPLVRSANSLQDREETATSAVLVWFCFGPHFRQDFIFGTMQSCVVAKLARNVAIVQGKFQPDM